MGAPAIVASLIITATYHLGYSDFRSSKLRKPVTGDLIWSVPTLATLNPIGAPLAHAGLHVAVVTNSTTPTFSCRRTDVAAERPAVPEIECDTVADPAGGAFDAITILLADDHALVRGGLKRLLGAEEDFRASPRRATQTQRSS